MECSSEVVACLLTNFDRFVNVEIYWCEDGIPAYIRHTSTRKFVLHIAC